MFYREVAFQETAIGKLPREWKVAELGNSSVAEIVLGQSPPSSTYNSEGIGLPFLQGKMEFGDRHPSPTSFCSEPTKVAEPNDILLSVRAPVGAVNIAKDKYCIGRGLSAIRTKTERLSHMFLFYYLSSVERRFTSLSMGSTFKAIRKEEIERFSIPLPQLQEQHKIAEVLSGVDLAIQKTGEVIAKTERLKKGLMQQLLTKGIGHKEYRDTPIGKIPQDWQFAELGQTFSIYDCKHRTPKYVGEGVPIVRPRDVQPDILNLDKCLKTSQDDYKDLTSKHAPRKGDIIFTRNASFGVACYVETDRQFSIGQDVVAISSDRQSTKFLFYVMNSDFMNTQVNRLSTGSTFKRINLHLIRKLKFALPPHPEQESISEILSAVDSKLKIEKEEKTRLERTKQGLMDLLLSGKVRVKVD
jgi:type I restriction enzyme S subunit